VKSDITSSAGLAGWRRVDASRAGLDVANALRWVPEFRLGTSEGLCV